MQDGPIASRLSERERFSQVYVTGEADLRFGRSWRRRFILEEDFAYAASADPNVIMPPWAVDLQTVNITGDFLNDQATGILQFASDATVEAQAGQLTWADQLMVSFGRPGFVEAVLLANYAGTTLTADERWVFGLASAHPNAEDALDTVTTNLWFRIEGASNTLLIEKDDGTDVDDQSTGRTFTEQAFHHLLIVWDDQAVCRFYLDGEKAGPNLSMAGLAAPDTNLVQPIFCYQRDAGNEVNLFDLDYVRCGNVRRVVSP